MAKLEEGTNWTCRYCNRPQVVLSARYSHTSGRIWADGSIHGKIGYFIEAFVCANDNCRKLSLWFEIVTAADKGDRWVVDEAIQGWQLLPESSAKPQPDYIPEILRNDYYEACRIRDLSPKSSATLTRRVLHGMIRDFCQIAVPNKRLFDEIRELRLRVEAGTAPRGVHPDTVDAIDHVRGIGNIGAHMEADINVVVDVDPGEAQLLIELIEMLFEEWYVAREIRATRLAAIGAVAAEKQAAKFAPPLNALPGPTE